MESQSRPEATARDIATVLHAHCCSSDPHVRNAAFQQLGEYLLRIAYSRLRTRADREDLADLAEDCTQQALAIIWQKLKDQHGPDHTEWFMSWSAGIVLHIVLDALRKIGRSRTDSLDEALEVAWANTNPDLPMQVSAAAMARAPEQSALRTEVARELLRLIQEHPRLSSDAKAVLLGGYLQERNDGELAAQLSKEAVTIRVIRARGLKILREDQRFMSELQALAAS